MENIGNSGVSGNRIASKYTYLGNSLEFRVVLEPCERILTGYVSRDFVDICFMFYPSLLPYVSLARTMSSFSLSWTPQLPSTLVYCTLLIVLRSRSCIPLRRIRSLVYIFCVLVLYNLRTNITYFSLVSV